MEENRSTRRDFLKKAGFVGATVTLGGLAEPLLAGSTKVFAATGEATQEIINLAVTAEQLATTFYYNGVTNAGSLPNANNQSNQPYLRAALDEENVHLQLLTKAGGKSVAGANPQFYFPKGTFSNDATFAAVLDALETAFIEAYLAAIYQFASDGRNDLAQLAGQIMGVEAEHRVLGRVLTNESVPNNLSLEKVAPKGSTVADVAKALVPFLSKGGNNTDGPYALPIQAQIQNVVSGVSDPNS